MSIDPGSGWLSGTFRGAAEGERPQWRAMVTAPELVLTIIERAALVKVGAGQVRLPGPAVPPVLVEARNKWRAQLYGKGRYRCLGKSDTEAEAAAAYRAALKQRSASPPSAPRQT